MAYAIVTFAFCGGKFDRKKYLFETTVQGLVKGDLVLVEGVRKDTTVTACFIHYAEVDRYNQFKRKRILNKIHPGEYAGKLVAKIEKLSELHLPNSVCNEYRNYFFGNESFDDDEVRLKILRNLVMSAIQFEDKNKQLVKYRFGDMLLIVKGNKLATIQNVRLKQKWIRPRGLSESLDILLKGRDENVGV